MTEEDLEKTKSKKGKTIHILHFTDLNSIGRFITIKPITQLPKQKVTKRLNFLEKP